MEAQINCPHCGALQKDSLFCKDCNKLLNMASASAPSQPKVQSKAEFKTTVQDVENNLASREKRFLNLILDYSFLLILTAIFGFILAFMGFKGVIANINESMLGQSLLELIISSCYYVAFESYYQKSIGKFITKTKVVTENGEPPSFLNILGRSLCRLIPFDPLSFLGKRAFGWHDSISKTRVINDNQI